MGQNSGMGLSLSVTTRLFILNKNYSPLKPGMTILCRKYARLFLQLKHSLSLEDKLQIKY